MDSQRQLDLDSWAGLQKAFAYFRLSEIARISPQRYQQIADRVDADSIEIDGQKVALIPENAPKIRAAIQTLRSQLRRPLAPACPPADVVDNP